MTPAPANPAKRPGRIALAGVILAGVVGVALGLGVHTFDYAEGSSYLSNDPKACVNCHIMREQYDSWEKGPHHAVATCNDCHVPQDVIGKYATKAEHGFRHSKGFTFQDFHEPIQITPGSLGVVEANCVRCHAGLTNDIRAVSSHDNTELSCTHCHSGIGHGPRR